MERFTIATRLFFSRLTKGQCITTINHFTNKGSNVYVSFLDCSKAFDRISHFGLFIKLIDRSVPLCFLLLIMAWHLNMTCRVKWGDAFSNDFPVPLGTKQGGIISPKFFAVYYAQQRTL